jgi:hypothetical protein
MPFNPKYKNTDKILNNLKSIDSAREIIEEACLDPELEAELRRQALLRNAHASTALAGNKLSLKQVEALFAKRNRTNK